MSAPQPRSRLPVLFWIGIGLVLFGTGPIVLLAAATNLGLAHLVYSNPIGLGVLSALTLWPGIGLAVAGIVMANDRRGSRARNLSRSR